ncbi:hypothetical protein LTR95_017166, partial [Oleoguttula sp. CCFEE 5521]
VYETRREEVASMPVYDLPAFFEVVLDAVEQAVFVYYLRVWIFGVIRGFANVVLLDYIVYGEVVQAGSGGELFAVGCFAYTRGAGDDYVGGGAEHGRGGEEMANRYTRGDQSCGGR